MGFGKKGALAEEAPDDYVEEPFETPSAPPAVFADPVAFEGTESGGGTGLAAGAIEFAPSLALAAANDAAVMSLADPDAASLEARLGEAFAEQAEATLPSAAPVLPQTSSPRVQPPPAGAPHPAAGPADAPPPSPTPSTAQTEDVPDDLPLSADQRQLLDSLGEEERAELRTRLQRERERLEADRRRLEAERKRLEAAGPVTGLAAVAHMLFPRRNTIERRQADFQAREAFLQTGFVGENYFRLKQRDFVRTAAAIAAKQAELGGTVRSYNDAFGATEPGRRYLDRVDRLIAAGMQREAAQAFVAEGNVVGAKEDAEAAARDPRVAAARSAMYETAGILEKTAAKFGADFELLQRNFPDKLDAGGTADVVKAFERIARETPKPVAEPGVPSDRTLEKRLAKMAEGIKDLVEAVTRMIQSIFRPKG